MSSKSKPSAVFFRGDNRDGLPVVATVTIGGNEGTGSCVGIAIFDAFIFDDIRKTFLVLGVTGCPVFVWIS